VKRSAYRDRVPELVRARRKLDATFTAHLEAEVAFDRLLRDAQLEHQPDCLGPRKAPFGMLVMPNLVAGGVHACSCGAEAYNKQLLQRFDAAYKKK
jgi:hypothetical protein